MLYRTKINFDAEIYPHHCMWEPQDDDGKGKDTQNIVNLAPVNIIEIRFMIPIPPPPLPPLPKS